MEAIEKHPQLQAGPEEMSQDQPTCDRLLNIEALNTIAKAARLLRDGERLYCSGKILLTYRPVFGQDPAARPNGAVITHTLKIGYHEGSGHVEFHVVWILPICWLSRRSLNGQKMRTKLCVIC